MIDGKLILFENPAKRLNETGIELSHINGSPHHSFVTRSLSRKEFSPVFTVLSVSDDDDSCVFKGFVDFNELSDCFESILKVSDPPLWGFGELP